MKIIRNLILLLLCSLSAMGAVSPTGGGGSGGGGSATNVFFDETQFTTNSGKVTLKTNNFGVNGFINYGYTKDVINPIGVASYDITTNDTTITYTGPAGGELQLPEPSTCYGRWLNIINMSTFDLSLVCADRVIFAPDYAGSGTLQIIMPAGRSVTLLAVDTETWWETASQFSSSWTNGLASGDFLGINSTNVGGYSLALTNTDSTIHLYSLLTDASNYRRLAIKRSGNDFLIGSEAAGSGVGNGALTFMTGGTNRWTIDKNGDFAPVSSARLFFGSGKYAYANEIADGYYSEYYTRYGKQLKVGNGLVVFGPIKPTTGLAITSSDAGEYDIITAIGRSARTGNTLASTSDMWFLPKSGNASGNASVRRAASVIFDMGSGGASSTTNTTAGNGGDFVVFLNNGGLGTGGATNGRSSQFMIYDYSTNLIFGSYGGGTNILASKTVIGTNPTTATVFNPSGLGTNTLSGQTTISNLIQPVLEDTLTNNQVIPLNTAAYIYYTNACPTNNLNLSFTNAIAGRAVQVYITGIADNAITNISYTWPGEARWFTWTNTYVSTNKVLALSITPLRTNLLHVAGKEDAR